MKKSLIALAVAGALAVPAIASADATLYGAVDVDGVFKNDTSADIEVDDAIVGLKGTVDLGMENVTGFFDFRSEFKVSPDAPAGSGDTDSSVTVDRALVGITGSFGTVQAGAMGNPVDATESLDVTSNSYSTDNWYGNPGDLTNAVAYVSPTMGGFTGYAGIVVDGGIEDGAATNAADGDDKAVDGYLLGFNYGIGAFTADVGYWDFAEDSTQTPASTDADFVGVSLQYDITPEWNATLMWEEAETVGATKTENELWGLGTFYTMGKTTIGATYLDFDSEVDGVKQNSSGDEWALTVDHKLSNRASVYAYYSDADVDAGSVAGERVLTVGYGLSF